jgi:hypothetical protein
MKIILNLIFLSLINGFVFNKFLKTNYKYFCKSENTTDKEPISIESITNLFKEYLKEEQNEILKYSPINPIPSTFKQNKNSNDIIDNNAFDEYLLGESQKLIIYNNFKKKELLNLLNKNEISETIKLQYIEMNEELFIENNNGGLLQDWDFNWN